MTTITETNENEKGEIGASLKKFFDDYKLAGLLKTCHAEKQKGHPALDIFRYLLCLVFCDRSMYMQVHTGRLNENFGKNTVYRFLNSARTNWERFVCTISERIINGTLRRLTAPDRKDAFIIDDTLFSRTGGKKTQLCSRVFDHVEMKMKAGFRLLTLGWTDGETFVPVLSRLLGSSSEKSIIGPRDKADARSLAGKRRAQALRKAPDVAVEMLRAALKAGHRAKYVLFDTWFSTPRGILRITRECRLHVIAMIKKAPKVFYEFEGEKKNLRQIYGACRKRCGRARFLLSVTVSILEDGKAVIPARIVCVRNRNNRKDWIAFICTDMSLSEEEIVTVYGKRWKIEVFFKTCKTMLNLGSECHSLSYDALTAHVSLVFIRYMFLALQERLCEDGRSFGELFFSVVDEIADISFDNAIRLIIDLLLQSVKEVFGFADSKLDMLADDFRRKLPPCYRRALKCSA